MQGFSPQLSTNAKGSDAAQLLDDPDVSKYKYNHLIKPPFSYSTLICMAMKAKGSAIDGKIALTQLLNWIADNFSYYKHSDPAWQVRYHNLVITNKFFSMCTFQAKEKLYYYFSCATKLKQITPEKSINIGYQYHYILRIYA